MALILSLVLCTAVAMIVHECGHLYAARRFGVAASEFGLGLGPRIFSFSIGNLSFSLRAFPVASYVRLDGTALGERPMHQQMIVHLGGIVFNLFAAVATHGTMFGWINLALGLINLLPLYKHDGWKCGVVIMRTILRKKSIPVEWTFTFSGGLVSLVIAKIALHLLHLK